MPEKILYNCSEIEQLMQTNRACLVDVRDSEDFQKGHIPGAVNIPEIFYQLCSTTESGLSDLQTFFSELFSNAGIRRDKTLVFYEDKLNTRYGGSCRGYFISCYLGHPDSGVLEGGLSQWLDEGHALSDQTQKPQRSNFVAQVNSAILASRNDVLQALEDSSVKLLDNRDEIEWVGESSSPYGKDFVPRKGRLSGAVWIEWYEFLRDLDSPIALFKSPEEIRELCASHNLYPDDDIIIYCFKGARASNTYVALKMAGFSHIRNYFGSWNEWSRDEKLPIDDRVLVA
jgi:thiosulfate/3-mercaptopyruvate sulfurtransferase